MRSQAKALNGMTPTMMGTVTIQHQLSNQTLVFRLQALRPKTDLDAQTLTATVGRTKATSTRLTPCNGPTPMAMGTVTITTSISAALNFT